MKQSARGKLTEGLIVGQIINIIIAFAVAFKITSYNCTKTEINILLVNLSLVIILTFIYNKFLKHEN